MCELRGPELNVRISATSLPQPISNRMSLWYFLGFILGCSKNKQNRMLKRLFCNYSLQRRDWYPPRLNAERARITLSGGQGPRQSDTPRRSPLSISGTEPPLSRTLLKIAFKLRDKFVCLLWFLYCKNQLHNEPFRANEWIIVNDSFWPKTTVDGN